MTEPKAFASEADLADKTVSFARLGEHARACTTDDAPAPSATTR